MRFNPYNEISAALAPDDEYPYNKLTPKDRKNSDQLLRAGRADSLEIPAKKPAELHTKPNLNNNANHNRSESQSIISRNEYNNERRPSQITQNTSAVALKNKSQSFYLRGYLKEQKLNMDSLTGANNVSIKEAEKFFDDEDE